jgi:hypothetical protein
MTKNTTKNKKLKFRSITKKTNLFLKDGYLSNGHWLFCTEWIESLKSKYSLGVKRALTKKTIQVVSSRLLGETRHEHDLESLVKKIPLREYTKINLNESVVNDVEGFPYGKLYKDVVAFKIKTKNSEILIATDYYVALLFDSEVEIHIKDFMSPIVLLKENKIVGLLCPVNPNYYNYQSNQGGL